jgi:hypothetical protein
MESLTAISCAAVVPAGCKKITYSQITRQTPIFSSSAAADIWKKGLRAEKRISRSAARYNKIESNTCRKEE